MLKLPYKTFLIQFTGDFLKVALFYYGNFFTFIRNGLEKVFFTQTKLDEVVFINEEKTFPFPHATFKETWR